MKEEGAAEKGAFQIMGDEEAVPTYPERRVAHAVQNAAKRAGKVSMVDPGRFKAVPNMSRGATEKGHAREYLVKEGSQMHNGCVECQHDALFARSLEQMSGEGVLGLYLGVKQAADAHAPIESLARKYGGYGSAGGGLGQRRGPHDHPGPMQGRGRA